MIECYKIDYVYDIPCLCVKNNEKVVYQKNMGLNDGQDW